MGSVLSVDDANLLSISRLSQLTGMARETIAKRIQGVKPSGSKNGHSVYHLRDVGPALFAQENLTSVDDPDDLPPRERKDFYDSQLKRLQYEKELGRLMSAEEVRGEWSKTLKAIMLSLDTLVDVIEREAGLEPEQVATMQSVIDRERESLFLQLSESCD